MDPTFAAVLSLIFSPVLSALGATWAAKRQYRGALDSAERQARGVLEAAERQAAAVIHAAELAAKAAADAAELNQRSAKAVAEISRTTQLEIERDRAVRDYRLQRVRRILDRADNRMADYFELNRLSIYPWEASKRDEVGAALLNVESKQLGVHVLGETADIPAAFEYVQAVHTLARIDGEWASAVRAAFKDPTSSFNALLTPHVTDYNEALRQAHVAAIKYVFG